MEVVVDRVILHWRLLEFPEAGKESYRTDPFMISNIHIYSRLPIESWSRATKLSLATAGLTLQYIVFNTFLEHGFRIPGQDRIKGHPFSIDAMVKLSEDRRRGRFPPRTGVPCQDGIITGSSDGKIRVVSVHSKSSRAQTVLVRHH